MLRKEWASFAPVRQVWEGGREPYYPQAGMGRDILLSNAILLPRGIREWPWGCPALGAIEVLSRESLQ